MFGAIFPHISRRALLGGVGSMAAHPAFAAGWSDNAASNARLAARQARRARLASARSWGYQLHSLDIDTVAVAPHDVLVIDYATHGDGREDLRPFTPREVRRMQIKPDGERRIVLAYLSIGEAERYRSYWDAAWDSVERAPAWLGPMNPQWSGNYAVRFWDTAWQRLIFGSPDSYLHAIMRQGFDGVYLDRADAFQEWRDERAEAEADMARFVVNLADDAQRVRPDFLVVMQNAEELLRHPLVLNTLDGVAKEDLYFGLDSSQGENSVADIANSLRYLRLAQRAGKPVMVVEYVLESEQIQKLALAARRERFLPHVAERSLGRLNAPLLDASAPIEP